MTHKPAEWFDVVNGRDEVIGRELRHNVHARGLWHRSVHVLVFDGAGRVFLQKRSMTKDLCPGLWDSSCSGHLDAGEDYDAAAVRELGEEIGVRVNPSTGSHLRQGYDGHAGQAEAPARWFRLNTCEETGWEFVWVYRLRHDGPLTLHPEEIDGGEWFAPAEVSAKIAARPEDFSPSFMLLWTLAEAKLR